MNAFLPVYRPILTILLVLRDRWEDGDRERGDVPGWVLITLMTAGLVTVLWGLASQTLTTVFTDAVNAVVNTGDNG